MAMVSVLTELDARHLGAVTLAVAGLEDARVPAVPCGEPRPDLLKQLVRRLALLDVATGEPARVQRAGTCLGDELLDERAQLLRLRFRRHDGLRLDERGGEVAHQRELLLAGATELTSSLPVTHGVTPLRRRAPRRQPGSAACPNRARARLRRSPRTASRSSSLHARGDRRSPEATSSRNSSPGESGSRSGAPGRPGCGCSSS